MIQFGTSYMSKNFDFRWDDKAKLKIIISDLDAQDIDMANILLIRRL